MPLDPIFTMRHRAVQQEEDKIKQFQGPRFDLFWWKKLILLFPTFNPISFSIFHLFFISLRSLFFKAYIFSFLYTHIPRWKWFYTSRNISWQSNFLNTTYTISLQDRKNVTLLVVSFFVWATLKMIWCCHQVLHLAVEVEIYYCSNHFVITY